VVRVGESEVVALEAKVLLLFVERAAHPRPGCSHRVYRLGAQRPPTVLGRLRLGPQQQTHTCGLVQRVGQQRVPADVEVGSGDVDGRPAHEAVAAWLMSPFSASATVRPSRLSASSGFGSRSVIRTRDSPAFPVEYVSGELWVAAHGGPQLLGMECLA